MLIFEIGQVTDTMKEVHIEEDEQIIGFRAKLY